MDPEKKGNCFYLSAQMEGNFGLLSGTQPPGLHLRRAASWGDLDQGNFCSFALLGNIDFFFAGQPADGLVEKS